MTTQSGIKETPAAQRCTLRFRTRGFKSRSHLTRCTSRANTPSPGHRGSRRPETGATIAGSPPPRPSSTTCPDTRVRGHTEEALRFAARTRVSGHGVSDEHRAARVTRENARTRLPLGLGPRRARPRCHSGARSGLREATRGSLPRWIHPNAKTYFRSSQRGARPRHTWQNVTRLRHKCGEQSSAC